MENENLDATRTKVFDEMDENKDGILDRNEQKKIIDLSSDIKAYLGVSLPLMFQDSDSDKDGNITLEEMSKYLLSEELDHFNPNN
jgi:Ca2+-binding EF-hand superfamily protein